MQITTEYIQTQIDNLNSQLAQHQANANACEGAIQVYNQMLAYLNLEPSNEEKQPHEGN